MAPRPPPPNNPPPSHSSPTRTFYHRQRASSAHRVCTPLAQRLACVRAVQSGRISIRAACRQRNISTRTYYRWLAQKDRLVQLTTNPGTVHSDGADINFEDDVAEQRADATHVARGPAPASAQVEVPPERRTLGQQPAEADVGQSNNAAETLPLMEVDALDDEKASPTQRPLPSEKPSNKSKQQADKQNDNTSEAGAVPAIGATQSATPRTGQPANTAGQNPPTTSATLSIVPSQPGNMPSLAAVGDADREVPVDGTEDPSDKHRIVVLSGSARVSLVWYDGARAEDIRQALARRFHLSPGGFFTLRDIRGHEVNVSQGLPSGTYDLLLV